ncbi:MAG: restriction endonuclease subunit S [Alteromonadaceae bacterium]|nr:restriction endonuclease subunit S [Alteromonadaceae bacterium]
MTDSAISPQWLTVPLEDVILRIVGGGTPSKSKPEYYRGKIPWMSVKDMNKHVLQDTVDHISQAAVDNSSTNVIPAGTPIIATRMSLGKIVIADFDSAINQDLKALFLPAEIHRDYLVYWYRSVARKIEQMGTGTTVKGIRLEALKGLEFALPPLPVPKVIADQLDTLLAQVESTKARLERIPKTLKRFRQSVLAAAVSGRLTEEFLASDHDYHRHVDLEIAKDKKLAKIDSPNTDEVEFAKELFESPDWDRWKLYALEQLVESTRGIPYGIVQTGEAQEEGIPTIRCGDVKPLHVETGSLKKVLPAIEEKYRRTRLNGGEVVLAIRGTVGNAAAISEELAAHPLNISREVAMIPVRKNISSQFVAILLQSPGGYRALAEKTKGVAQRGINLSDVKRLVTPLPTLSEQTEIVRRVDQLFAHADRIEQQVNNALARVNNLTQSILAKAFRGELTEQWRKENPELISGENSAEALLERIKEEQAAMKPVKKTRSKQATV